MAGALLGLPKGWRQETGEGIQSCRDGPRAGEPPVPMGGSGAFGVCVPLPRADSPLCLCCPQMKYIQDFQREKQEFERNLARFR